MKYDGTAALAPPESTLEQALQQAMLWTLAFFLFILPLEEAPKNLAAVVFVVLWVVHAVRTRDVGGRWNLYDTTFAFVLASGVVSGLAGYAGDIKGMVRVFLLAWLASRTALPQRAASVLPISACVGVVVAIACGFVPLLRGAKTFLELPSVGQVNQSALYIAILAACTFGWWLQRAQSGQGGRMRTGMGLAAIICCAGLLVGASRAAVVATGLAVVVIAIGVLSTGGTARARRLIGRTVLIVAVLAGLAAALGARDPVLSDRKLTPDGLFKLASTETRIKHWNLALEAWRQHPWLGWGPDSFGRVKIDEVCAWREQRGEDCDRSLYMQQVHPHSLYAGTLLDRGVVGALSLVLLAVLWGASLLRSRASAGASWLWPASAAGFMVAFIGGTFNTTLRVEHGSIAVLFFGLWIAAHGRAWAVARLDQR
jgi:O-antigen ligase